MAWPTELDVAYFERHRRHRQRREGIGDGGRTAAVESSTLGTEHAQLREEMTQLAEYWLRPFAAGVLQVRMNME